ncbi:MAG: hypothetical protein AB1749_02825 [Pseudomonadota bacterium]
MSMKTLMSAAQAAGYAMAASEELLTVAGKTGTYETRGLEPAQAPTPASPARWTHAMARVEWQSGAIKATAVKDWVAGWLPTRATA